ncbi:sugar phosphate isomerase/epimerase [Brachybacterium horti]
MQISVQMYSVRDALAEDYQGTVGRLVELGFAVAEPFALLERRDELVKARDSFEIAFPSAHQSFLGDDDFTPVLEAAKAVGVTYLVDPFWNPEDWKDEAGVASIAQRLNQRAQQAAAEGIRVGYHNHAFEVSSRIGDRSALEVLAEQLDPEVVLEVDTYWAAVGGADVPALLSALGDRVRLVHLKDGDLAEDPAGQLPLGEGRMPLPGTLAASAGVDYGVIEFDQYAGDMFDGIATSLTYLRARA